MHVVGARPNFMKIAPIMREFARFPEKFSQVLVHTGQHYDDKMSRIFFEELELPEADVNLSVGSGTHAWQTAQVMMRFEPVVLEHKPDWVLVPGDVNSTVACALVCSKLGIRVAHVEAGLRSFDRTMPEEINRIVTDQISDLLFTPSPDANENLYREGVPEEKVHFVGNVMIDTLVHLIPKAEQRWDELRSRYCLDRYVLATLHRPANVDDPQSLDSILAAFADVSRSIPVIFPVHPRTRQRISDAGALEKAGIRLIEPLGYLEFLAMQRHASLVITDSGGVQEETTYLGVPCLTLRPNTERPVTITEGTNTLIEGGPADLGWHLRRALAQADKRTRPQIRFWDGCASRRIVDCMRQMADPRLAARA